jgi:hypothetical protein
MFCKLLRPRRFFIITLLHMPLLTGCELPVTVEEGLTKIEVVSGAQASPGASGSQVCDPFGSAGSQGRNQGLKGELYSLAPGLPNYTTLDPYFSFGTRAPADLYMNQVNVPTRPFDAGFITLDGEVLKNTQGNTLYEWFALRLEANLRLVQGDRTGKKQFALLTDDGSRLQMKIDGVWQTVINNDDNHPTKLLVSTQPIEMNHQSDIPLEFKYFQGPRYHIAVMILWRDWPEGEGEWQEPLNGASGNSLYFDSTKSPPVPQPAYQALLDRGWKPIPAANFFLPNGVVTENPCPEENVNPPEDPSEDPTPEDPITDPTTENPTDPATLPLVISGFDGTTGVGSADIIWQTVGVPSTSKIVWGTSPDQLNFSMENLNPQTVHQMTITGLQPATVYYFRAESKDAAGRTVNSSVLIKATK